MHDFVQYLYGEISSSMIYSAAIRIFAWQDIFISCLISQAWIISNRQNRPPRIASYSRLRGWESLDSNLRELHQHRWRILKTHIFPPQYGPQRDQRLFSKHWSFKINLWHEAIHKNCLSSDHSGRYSPFPKVQRWYPP